MKSQNNSKFIKHSFSIIMLIIVTVLLYFLMSLFKVKEEQKIDIEIKPTVDYITLESIDYSIPIQTQGVVVPKREITLNSEIVGKIIEISENFSTAGAFVKGEILVVIDPKDYQLAITKSKANVASAQAVLDLENATSELAKNDWQKYGKKGKPSALNLNLPQVASAKASLASAQADLQLAKNNLSKTTIRAPFDGVVFSKHVDVGQFVTIGAPLATVAAIDVAEISVTLSDVQLKNSGLMENANSTMVTISSDELKPLTWSGQVKNIQAQRNVQTLLNSVVIEVQWPMTQQRSALRFNSFVNVEFNGMRLNSVFPLKREYLSLNKTINTIDDQSKLKIKAVNVLYSDDDYHYINQGLSNTDKVIVTQLSNVPEGAGLISGKIIESSDNFNFNTNGN